MKEGIIGAMVGVAITAVSIISYYEITTPYRCAALGISAGKSVIERLRHN